MLVSKNYGRGTLPGEGRGCLGEAGVCPEGRDEGNVLVHPPFE